VEAGAAVLLPTVLFEVVWEKFATALAAVVVAPARVVMSLARVVSGEAGLQVVERQACRVRLVAQAGQVGLVQMEAMAPFEAAAAIMTTHTGLVAVVRQAPSEWKEVTASEEETAGMAVLAGSKAGMVPAEEQVAWKEVTASVEETAGMEAMVAGEAGMVPEEEQVAWKEVTASVEETAGMAAMAADEAGMVPEEEQVAWKEVTASVEETAGMAAMAANEAGMVPEEEQVVASQDTPNLQRWYTGPFLEVACRAQRLSLCACSNPSPICSTHLRRAAGISACQCPVQSVR
jgi:hypothetical protein